jgi:hypothetical protein
MIEKQIESAIDPSQVPSFPMNPAEAQPATQPAAQPADNKEE